MKLLITSVALCLSVQIAQATEVFLKSGGQATLLSTSLMQAPDALGGPEAGNIFQIRYKARNWKSANLVVDARSLCHVHAMAAYQEKLGEWSADEGNAVATLQNLGFHIDGPVVAIDIVIVPESQLGTPEDGIWIGLTKRFDMRGLVKCRPLGG